MKKRLLSLGLALSAFAVAAFFGYQEKEMIQIRDPKCINGICPNCIANKEQMKTCRDCSGTGKHRDCGGTGWITVSRYDAERIKKG